MYVCVFLDGGTSLATSPEEGGGAHTLSATVTVIRVCV